METTTHNESNTNPPVGTLSEIAPGKATCVNFEGEEVAIFNVEGTLYAIGNKCPHVGAPLCDGILMGDQVRCPLHAARFDLKTGEVLSPPAQQNVPSYKVRVENDQIFLEK